MRQLTNLQEVAIICNQQHKGAVKKKKLVLSFEIISFCLGNIKMFFFFFSLCCVFLLLKNPNIHFSEAFKKLHLVYVPLSQKKREHPKLNSRRQR